ncbi:DUF1565 domain-containing protein, partial [Parapedobacter soli]|uniref:DUF1565 domain-containing protein n=1 Tax=Parapedobacter soli TaxID=416955 RepID=UPI0021C93C36
MEIKRMLLVLGICSLVTSLNAATYYVALNGDDANSGTKAHPYATIQRAQEAVVPGDTVYIRGGTYAIRAGQIAAYELKGAGISLLRILGIGFA